MGSFDTSKTDNALRTLFKKKTASKYSQQEEADKALSKEEQAIELLKGMTPEQIMAVISAINK
ncbi:MAG: hypothetical protein K2J49_00175 [Muribaculaceae bacterium]|nr:hypothetical protein [Muribaculaceae bacterium]